MIAFIDELSVHLSSLRVAIYSLSVFAFVVDEMPKISVFMAFRETVSPLICTLRMRCVVSVRLVSRGPIYNISYDLAYDYRKFIVRSTYDSDLTGAEISLREYRKLIYDTIFDDIMILHVNLTYEKLSIHCKMFCKLDVRRKSIVTLPLS